MKKLECSDFWIHLPVRGPLLVATAGVDIILLVLELRKLFWKNLEGLGATARRGSLPDCTLELIRIVRSMSLSFQ